MCGTPWARIFPVLREQGTALNIVLLIGHGTIRTAAMGFDDRA